MLARGIAPVAAIVAPQAAGGMLRGDLHAPAVGEVMRWPEWE